MLDEILTDEEDKATGSKSEFEFDDEQCSILEVGGIYPWPVW